MNNEINKSTREHLQVKRECDGEPILEKTNLKIISTSWQLKCNKCSYVNEPENMYTENTKIDMVQNGLR